MKNMLLKWLDYSSFCDIIIYMLFFILGHLVGELLIFAELIETFETLENNPNIEICKRG